MKWNTYNNNSKSLEEDTEEAGLNLEEEEKAAVAARSPNHPKIVSNIIFFFPFCFLSRQHVEFTPMNREKKYFCSPPNY
jgi:hypothetical protein